jgi:hypothetical protein
MFTWLSIIEAKCYVDGKDSNEGFFLPLHRACCHIHLTKNQLMHLFQNTPSYSH